MTPQEIFRQLADDGHPANVPPRPFLPMSDTELTELQRRWMTMDGCGDSPESAPPARRIHDDGLLAEDWTAEQPPFPESVLTGEDSNRYSRHTNDYVPYIPVMRDDEPAERYGPWKCLVALAIVVVFGMGCWAFARWAAHR